MVLVLVLLVVVVVVIVVVVVLFIVFFVDAVDAVCFFSTVIVFFFFLLFSGFRCLSSFRYILSHNCPDTCTSSSRLFPTLALRVLRSVF